MCKIFVLYVTIVVCAACFNSLSNCKGLLEEDLTSIELSMELHSISDIVILVKSLKGKRADEARWKQAAVMYAVWLIWKQHNDEVFSNKTPNSSSVLLYTLAQAKEVWYIDAKCYPFLHKLTGMIYRLFATR